MKTPLVLLVSALAWSCSAPENSGHSATSQAPQPSAAAIIPKPLPRIYWPLDHTKEQKQTVVAGMPSYRATVSTTCLNDSAVVNPITLDSGPALAVSHNYESDLVITRNGHIWQQERLTKAIFQGNTTAQALGPLSGLALSFTAFSGYRKPDFLFYTRLGVPDSDIFVEAEVALSPGKALRLVSVREQELSEPE